jgi:ketosteroid isomerase-like protein
MAKAMLALVLAVLGAAAPLAADGQHRLVGARRFLREVDTKADGSPAPVAALSDCDGLLIYTADGFVSVNIMPKGRTWSTDTATLDEFRETVGNGTAYAGRYEVDTSAHTVTHITAVSLEPDYQNKRLVRGYSFEGESLQLSGTFNYKGETIRFVLTWAPAAAVQEPRAADASAENEISRLIRARLDAYERADASGWAQHVADDCLCGPLTKAELQREMANRLPGVKNWYGEILDLQIRRFGDVAVARYRVTEYAEVGGQRTSFQTWRSETHALRAGAWKLIALADSVIPPEPVVAEVDPQIYDAYVGRYQYAPGAIDTVTREGDRLFVQSTGQAKEELFPENETTYFAKGQDWRLVFVKDARGLVTSLRFRQNGQDFVAQRMHVDKL